MYHFFKEYIQVVGPQQTEISNLKTEKDSNTSACLSVA